MQILNIQFKFLNSVLTSLRIFSVVFFVPFSLSVSCLADRVSSREKQAPVNIALTKASLPHFQMARICRFIKVIKGF